MMGRACRMLAAGAAMAAACAVCWAGAPAKVDWRESFGQVRRLIREGKLPEAERQIDSLLAQEHAATPQRLEAEELRGLVRLEQGKANEALAIWRETEKQAAGLNQAQPRGMRYTEAAKYFLRAGAFDDAARAVKKALAAGQEAHDLGFLAQMHVYEAILCEHKGQAAEAGKARARMREILCSPEGREKLGWVLSRLRDVGRDALALEVADETLKAEPLAGAGDNLLQLGNQFRKDGEAEIARHCYALGARVPWDSAWTSRFPRQCLQGLAEMDLDGNRLDAALGEARLLYLFAEVQHIQGPMNLVAQILKKADGDINKRVRAFLEYQRYGKPGKDGQAGTADDLQDPLAAVPLPKAEPLGKLDDLLARTDPLDAHLRMSLCMQHRRFDMALVEAMAAYRAATDEKLADPIYAVATALKAMDGDLLRANRYLMFQQAGPAGKDGRPGTGDDLADPLQGIQLPGVPRRDKQFADAVAACNDTPEGLRRKGVLLLAWGKSQEGLEVMKEIYARCGVQPDALKEAILGVAAGLKAIDGHVHRANQYLLYQKHGPDGPDGIKGTADDVRNPLEAPAKR